MNDNLFSVKDKNIIITGATGYFGKIFTECLLSFDANVIILAKNEIKLNKLISKLSENYDINKIDSYVIDLYNTTDYKKCLESILNKYICIDVLINNAYDFSVSTGFNDNSGRIENISKDQWMLSMESGVYWSALSTQIIGKNMKQYMKGSIINICSMYGIVSPDPYLYEDVDVFNPPSYGASKAALSALTRYTASFYGKYNIRCNSISPGAFPNIDNDSYNSIDDDKFFQKLSNKTVLGRHGNPNDLRGIIVFLSSDASSYITGQSIVVDGGWTII